MGEEIAGEPGTSTRGEGASTTEAFSPRHATDRLTLALVVGAVPALILAGVPEWLERHHPLDAVSRPTASPLSLAFAWVALALVAVGAVWTFLLPGVLLLGSWKRVSSLAVVMLLALCVGIPVWGVVTHLVRGAGLAPGGVGFRGVVILVWGAAYGIGRARARRTGPAAEWMWGRGSRWQLVVTSAGVFALALLFGPRLAWQDPSPDGAHMFETARNLVVNGTPFWGRQWVDAMSSWPGLNTFAFLYPAAWHMYLLGAVDSAVRIPFLLYLALVPFALVALAAVRRPATPDRGIFLPAWLSTVVYAVTVAYSATYDAYTADIALPSSQDTLFVVTILAFLVGFLESKVELLVPALLLSLFGLPSGIQLALMWLAIAAVALRPLHRRVLVATMATLATFLLAKRLVPSLLAAVGLPSPGREHSLASLVRYYGALQITDVRRLLYVIVPGGILPAVAVWWWSGRDRVAAALTALTAVYFVAFYVQAATQLHYYIPAMLLPVAVHLRGVERFGGKGWRMATALAAVVALALSWPPHLQPVTLLRGISNRVVIREPGYEQASQGYFRSVRVLSALFRSSRGELSQFDGSMLALQRHARRQETIDSTTRYLVQRLASPVPPGFAVSAVREPFALLVRAGVGTELLSPRFPPGVAAIYLVPHDMRLPGSAKDAPRVWYIRPRIEQWLNVRPTPGG